MKNESELITFDYIEQSMVADVILFICDVEDAELTPKAAIMKDGTPSIPLAVLMSEPMSSIPMAVLLINTLLQISESVLTRDKLQ